MAKYTEDEDDLLDDDNAPDEASDANDSSDDDEKETSPEDEGDDNVSESSESANEPEQQQPDVPPAQMAPSVPQAQPPPVPEDKMAVMKQFLQDKMGNANADYTKASDMSGVTAAQEKAKHIAKIARVGEALDTIAHAISSGRGRNKLDSGFYQGIENEGQQGVKDAMVQRQANVQDFLQKQAIDDRIVQQMRMQGTMEQQQQANAYLQMKRDPNSSISASYREALKQISPELGNNENLSADDIVGGGLIKAATSTANKKLSEKIHNDNVVIANKNRADAATDKANTQREKELDKMEYRLSQDLNPEKGRAGNYGKNMSRVEAGDRILTLIDSRDENGNPVDPNNLTATQIGEIARDFDAMQGNGGGGSVETFKHILPSSMAGEASKLWSYVSGGPKPANMGEFVKQLKDSTLRQRQTALATAKKTENAVLSGYRKLKEGRPDNYDMILKSSVASQMALDSGNSSGGKSGGTLTAEDRDALKWASENPKDKRAIQIMKLHSPAPEMPTTVGAQ